MTLLVDNGFANTTFKNLRGDLTMLFDLVQDTAPKYDGVTVTESYIEEIDGYRVRAVDVVTKKNRIADAVYGNALEQAAFRGQLGDPQSLVSNADKVITSSVLQAYGTTDGMPSGYDGNTAALLITQAFGDTNASSNDKDVMQFAVFEALETNRPDIYWRHSHSADKDLPTWSEWIRLRFESFVGATASAAGAAGFVPAPAAGDQNKFLYGDGNWSLVTDVAIGGDENDMASARGQIGNSKVTNSHDFSSGMLSEKPGMYTAMKSGSTNVPFTGPFAEMILGSPTYRGSLLITSGRPTLPRAAVSTIDTEQGFSGYNRLITEQQIGDGLTVNNGIISVPEYDGVTASTDGTSGLVPPAAAGQANYVLCGDGEWRDITTSAAGDFVPDSRRVIAGTGMTGGGPLSADVTLAVKLTDSVSLEDSKTAASAKAVKKAYDLANSKQANLGFTPVQQGGGTGQNNTKIYIGSAGASGLKAQQGTTDLGNIVTTTAGTTRAPSATKVYVENFGEMSWISVQYANSPANVWCLPANSNYAHLCSPSVLSVGASQLTITAPNTRIFQTNGTLPKGGSWVLIVSRNGNGVVAQLAGGSTVDTSGGVALAIRVQ